MADPQLLRDEAEGLFRRARYLASGEPDTDKIGPFWELMARIETLMREYHRAIRTREREEEE
jgi:hypothetical protein